MSDIARLRQLCHRVIGSSVYVTAEEGDKGFGKLRKELQKAGLETE
jgi:hypothetical protein